MSALLVSPTLPKKGLDAADFEEADLRRLASLLAHGMTEAQICDALRITDAQLSRAVATEAFQAFLAEKKQELLALEVDKVEGWDQLEMKAVRALDTVIQWNKNPDFLLKAAALANKATRRPQQSPGNKPIGNGEVGQIVVLTLKSSFIRELDGTLDITPARDPRDLPPLKQTDLPPPKMVEQLLISPIMEAKTRKVDIRRANPEVQFDDLRSLLTQGAD